MKKARRAEEGLKVVIQYDISISYVNSISLAARLAVAGEWLSVLTQHFFSLLVKP